MFVGALSVVTIFSDLTLGGTKPSPQFKLTIELRDLFSIVLFDYSGFAVPASPSPLSWF
jgi:hypothetical protein